MKRLTLLLVALATLFVLPAPAQQDLNTLYKQGVALYNQQQYEEAKKIFTRVLQVRPDFVYARSYLAKCNTAIAADRGPSNDIAGQLAEITLPQFSFNAAPIGDVLTYLTQRTEELSGGKVVPNFIFKGTSEQRDNLTVTINLRNIPVTEAIRYVGQLTRTRFTYEEHAIVADPNYHQAAAEAARQRAEQEAAARKQNSIFGAPSDPIFD